MRAALVARLYSAGCNTRAISTYLGISHGTTIGIVTESGIPRRPRGRPKAEDASTLTPMDVMGADFVPEWFTEAETTLFRARVAAYDELYGRRTSTGSAAGTKEPGAATGLYEGEPLPSKTDHFPAVTVSLPTTAPAPAEEMSEDAAEPPPEHEQLELTPQDVDPEPTTLIAARLASEMSDAP